jgi:hypothetical protein
LFSALLNPVRIFLRTKQGDHEVYVQNSRWGAKWLSLIAPLATGFDELHLVFKELVLVRFCDFVIRCILGLTGRSYPVEISSILSSVDAIPGASAACSDVFNLLLCWVCHPNQTVFYYVCEPPQNNISFCLRN